MKRALLALLLVSSAVIGSVGTVTASGSDSDLLGAGLADASGFTSFDATNAVEYDDGEYGFVVTYTDGDLADVEEWANESDSRSLEETDADDNRVLVSASPKAVGATDLARLNPLNSPLTDAQSVESVAVEMTVELPDAPEQMSADDYSTVAREQRTGVFEDAASTDGIAFEANETRLSDVREVVGANDVQATGDGVTVAVVDTGLNHANESVFDGAVNQTAAYNSISENSSMQAVEDGSGHGTWAATAVHEVAPGAEIIPVKSLADDGSGSSADVADGIEYACERADVVSLSLGSPVTSGTIDDEVESCYDNGTTVIVASGNSRTSTHWMGAPARSEKTVAVGATNTLNASDAESTYFSSVGPSPETGVGVDVAAPGFEVTAEVPTTSGTVENHTLSGTSMSTPIVTGVTATLMESDNSLTDSPHSVKHRLSSTARPVPSASVSAVGHGMVAADKAVQDDTDGEQAEEMSEVAATRTDANSAVAGSWVRQFVESVSEVSV